MGISMDNKTVRKMGLLLLDNYDGVDIKAYEILSALLVQTDNADILAHVDIYEDANRHCAFIGEDYAEEELAKLDETDVPEPTGVEEEHLADESSETMSEDEEEDEQRADTL